MLLIIHNVLSDKALVALFQEKRLLKKIESKKKRSNLLFLINKLLKNKLKDLKGIIVVNGPGSFTSIRLSLAAANILSFLLKIKAVGVGLNEFNTLAELEEVGSKKLEKVKRGERVKPFYNKEPNITKPKRYIVL